MRKRVRAIRTAYIPLLMFILFSCDEDSIKAIRPLDSYNANYMFYQQGIMPEPVPVFTLEFDFLGRVTKRTGALLATNPATGFDYVFSSGIYDDVMISDHTTILKVNLSDIDAIDQNKREIFYQRGKIKFIVRNSQPSPELIFYDTTFFVYNSNQLEKTIRRNWNTYESELYFNSEEVKDFYYEDQNLVRIQGRKETWWPEVTTTLELFESYDSAPNPTKPLIIFDEVFYRSLSKNNFTKYSYQKKNADGFIVGSASRTWTLNYDENGIPTYK